MNHCKLLINSLALVSLIGAAGVVPASAADAKPSTTMKMLDPDNDGTLDLAEAKKAGEAKFDSINPDKDGTVDSTEGSKVGLSKDAIKKADPDDDKTLDKDEYAKLVEARFKAADPDNDGTVSDAELKTQAGKALLKLIK